MLPILQAEKMSFQHTIHLIYSSTAALSVALRGTTFQALKIMLPSKLSMWSYTINSFCLLE